MILFDIETKTVVRSTPMVFHLKALGEEEADAIEVAENNVIACLRSFYQSLSGIPWDSIDRFLDESITFDHVITISEGF